MKFFHLSDLHIDLKLINRDLKEDQQFILAKIAEAAEKEQPDAVEVFDTFVSELRKAVPEAEIMMISGNHDSAPRINVFRRRRPSASAFCRLTR